MSAAEKTATDLCLPWRKNTREDDHITDEIDFSPSGSAAYRFILDRHDELVAVVCVESIDADAREELRERVNLFLAAPAMKAALDFIASRIADHGNLAASPETLAEWNSAIRAALSKAGV